MIAETLYNYDNCSRLHYKETDGSEGTSKKSFEYDEAGNLTYKNEVETTDAVTESREYSYLYNGFNQLAEVTDPDGANYAYAYNAEGLRTSKFSQDSTINYLYENGYILIETDGDGIVTAKSTWGIGNRLALRETEDVIYGYRYNGHGDIIALTDASGSVVEDYAYDPYGNAVEESDEDVADGYTWSAGTETAQVDNPFRYCGEYYDLSSGTYYLRARYYDPTIGRFLSEDNYTGQATDPLSLNLYTYCKNNPIRWIDPSGKAVTEWDRARVYSKYVERLEAITAAWSSGTKEQQDQWRAEAEAIRAKYRHDEYEYTDSSGITRSKITNNEIKYVNKEFWYGSAIIRVKAGYSFDNNDKVVLNQNDKGVYIFDEGVGVDYVMNHQDITTDGSYIYYSAKFTFTISTQHWWIPWVTSDEGGVSGSFGMPYLKDPESHNTYITITA